MKRIVRSTLQTTANLVFFALIGTAILAVTHALTEDTIARTVEQEKLKLIGQVLSPASYDNDLLRDSKPLPADALLGGLPGGSALIARQQGRPVAVVLEAVAREGYGGNIRLLMAIRADGSVSGVRVVAHKETPGLGDYIELGKSDWIRQFDGLSRTVRTAADWQVKKDGGQFDYMAGATITPRAVVKGVHLALQYFDQHRDELFAPMQEGGPQ
ncbi:MAG: electron transport complex subunit RsxG [Sideroxydans sp.]